MESNHKVIPFRRKCPYCGTAYKLTKAPDGEYLDINGACEKFDCILKASLPNALGFELDHI